MQKDVNTLNSITSETLKTIFDIDHLKEYERPTLFKEGQVGFSVQRKYPEKKFRYIPPITKNREPDRVALIHVAYLRSRNSKVEAKQKQLPLFLSIGIFSRYLENHLDYDFKEDDCPTEESIQKSKSTPRPIDLEVYDEYVYDIESNTLQTTRGKIVAGAEILEAIYNKHCSSVHLLKGLGIRWKIGSRNILVKIIDVTIHVFKRVLNTAFGRTLKTSPTSTSILEPYSFDDTKPVKPDYINLFGYKASKNVIMTFSLTMILIYLIIRHFQIKFFFDILSNNIVSICAALLLLGILDHLVPKILLWCINKFNRLIIKVLLWKFRV